MPIFGRGDSKGMKRGGEKKRTSERGKKIRGKKGKHKEEGVRVVAKIG